MIPPWEVSISAGWLKIASDMGEVSRCMSLGYVVDIIFALDTHMK